MKTILVCLLASLMSVFFSPFSEAALYRESDSVFLDDSSGLFWFDNPGYFDGNTRTDQGAMIANLSVSENDYLYSDWRWATQSEIRDLFQITFANTPELNWFSFFDGTWVDRASSAAIDLFANAASTDGLYGSDVQIMVKPDDGTWSMLFFTDTDIFTEEVPIGALAVADTRSAAAPVPEPASLLLVAVGLAGLAGMRRIKKKL
jgi:PEP-CTERM motif